MPGANVFQTDGALAYSLPILTVRPWCRGERRLLRPPSSQVSGYCYTLLFTDEFSRRADMYAVSAAEFTTGGTADILYAHNSLGMPGQPPLRQCSTRLLQAVTCRVQKNLGMRKIAASAYHPIGIDGVERVNHTMAHMLVVVCNER